MRSRWSNLGQFSVAFLTVLVMATLLGIYLFVYIPTQREYFIKRNLRILTVMSNQVKSKIENFSTVIHNIAAAVATYDGEERDKRIVENFELVPSLALIKRHEHEVPASSTFDKKSHEDKINLHMQHQGNTYSLHFEYVGIFPERGKIEIHAASNLNELLAPIVERGELDDFLIVRMGENGHIGGHADQGKTGEKDEGEALVIYQKSKSELRIVKLDTLVDRNGRKFVFGHKINHSGVEDIKLLETDYKLFLQPFTISLQQQDVESDETEAWVLVGLVETERFNSVSRAISKHLVVLFFFIVLIAILSLPIIKIKFIGPRDRLKLIDIGLLGYSLLIGVSLLTIAVLNLYSYMGMQRKMDESLEVFASDVTNEVHAEIRKAQMELKRLNGQREGRVQTSILAKGIVTKSDPYTFFDVVFWVDSLGMQKTKWTVQKSATPLINVGARDYFKKVVVNRLWSIGDSAKVATNADTSRVILESARVATKGDASRFIVDSARGATKADASRFMLQSIYSWTTGRNEAVLSVPVRGNPSLTAACIVTRLTSLIDPVIPAGYGFCIIDNEGTVLFHSDEKRNLQENFFLESDNNARLRSAVLGQAKKHLYVKYLGSDHRLYVTPFKDLPWTLITFRDEEIFSTINIELITMAVGMFVGYLFLITFSVLLIWVVISLLGRLRRSPAREYFWLWPEYGKRGVYSFSIIVFLILNAMFGYIILTRDSAELFYFTALFPVLGLFLFYLLNREPSQSSVIKAPFQSLLNKAGAKVIVPSSAFDARFVTLVLCMIVLVGVLPSLAFFKIAHQMELELLIKHSQTKFAEALEKRAESIKSHYAKINLPAGESDDFINNRLTIDEDFPTEFDVYGFPFASRNTNPIHQLDPDDEEEDNHEFESNLAHLMLLYNKTTIEIRELIHDTSADMKRHWERREGKITLHKQDYYGDQCIEIASVLPPFLSHFWKPFDKAPQWWLSFQILLGLFGIIVASGLFVLIRVVVRKLFLTDFSLMGSPSSEINLKNAILINPPEKIKRKLVQKEDTHVISLVEVANGDSWSETYPYSKLPAGKTVVVDHFEHQMSLPESNIQKLRFLEELVYTHKKSVVLLSNVDPENFTFGNQNGSGANADGRKSNGNHCVLEIFHRAIVLDYGNAEDLSEEFVKHKKEIAKIPDRKRKMHALRMCDLLYNECFPTAELHEICQEMMQTRDFIFLDRVELITEIQDRAGHYYRRIWLACSKEERLALIYLAKDRFANLTNRHVMQNLLKSGLILRHPGFRLMNESFKKFVLEGHDSVQVVKWARQNNTSSWGKLKMPVMIVLAGVLLFLFSTQAAAFKSTVSIISAVAAGIPALIKVMSSLKFGSTDSQIEA